MWRWCPWDPHQNQYVPIPLHVVTKILLTLGPERYIANFFHWKIACMMLYIKPLHSRATFIVFCLYCVLYGGPDYCLILCKQKVCTHSMFLWSNKKKIWIPSLTWSRTSHNGQWVNSNHFRETESRYCKFSVFRLLWPWKLGQGHQNIFSSLLCSNYISMKIW